MLTFKNVIVTIFIFFCFQQSILAQSYKEYEMDTYSQVMIVVVLILMATIFIGFEVLDNPKYIVKETTAKKEKKNTIQSFANVGYELDSRIIYLFKMGFYTIILLSAIYLLIVILMLKIIQYFS